jgi:protein disulfide-isomerase A1
LQDATANDISSDLFEVKGYPTMYFHSASGVVTQFEDDQTDVAIIEFINKLKSNRSEESKAVPKQKAPEAEEEEQADEGQTEPLDLEEVVEGDEDVKDEL